MNLYNLHIVEPGHYKMAKFDSDFNVAAVYDLTAKGAGYSCNCPASARVVKYKPCKHQRMLPYMLGAVNTDRFYDPETGRWHQPLAIDKPEISVEGGGVGNVNGHPLEPPKEPANAPPVQVAEERRRSPPPPTSHPVITRRI